jgi:crossover junction endonuclease EME1
VQVVAGRRQQPADVPYPTLTLPYPAKLFKSKPRRPPSPAMASSNVPVVVYLDDDDVVATPLSSRNRKRSHGSASSRDSPDAFSSSPPLHKRLLLAASASAPIDLDDTPPPPRRRPPSAPEPPVHVLDDDTDPSVITDGYVPETPHSVLARPGSSQTPELDASRSVSPDIVVAETPGFTSPRSGRPPARHGFSSAGPAQKSSGN